VAPEKTLGKGSTAGRKEPKNQEPELRKNDSRIKAKPSQFQQIFRATDRGNFLTHSRPNHSRIPKGAVATGACATRQPEGGQRIRQSLTLKIRQEIASKQIG
jgi:hypothetical protein